MLAISRVGLLIFTIIQRLVKCSFEESIGRNLSRNADGADINSSKSALHILFKFAM